MDILEAIAIELSCASCGTHYDIPLRQVLISEQMLHEGCPVPRQFTNECSPLNYAHLVERNLILELERIWLSLEERAPEVGGKFVLRSIQGAANSDPCADEDGEAGSLSSHQAIGSH